VESRRGLRIAGCSGKARNATERSGGRKIRLWARSKAEKGNQDSDDPRGRIDFRSGALKSGNGTSEELVSRPCQFGFQARVIIMGTGDGRSALDMDVQKKKGVRGARGNRKKRGLALKEWLRVVIGHSKNQRKLA